MSKTIIAQDRQIVIGVDIHDIKHQLCVATTDGEELKNWSIPGKQASWNNVLEKLPGCRITVVYEAGGNGYNLYDYIIEKGHECVVVGPQKNVGIKTDKRDARALARDYLANRIIRVTVPCFKKRVDRQVLRTRNQIKAAIKRIKNQVASLRKLHGLDNGFGAMHNDNRGYLDYLQHTFVEILVFLEEKIKGLEGALNVICREEEYAAQTEALLEISGVGPLTAAEVILGIADITAFKTSGQAASYTGLCPSESSSGEKRRQGSITRRGPGRLRSALVQCAWSRVRHVQEDKARYLNIKSRKGSRIAIVAIARRLMVTIWWKLKELEPDPGPAAASMQ
jgi:transposase